MKTNQEKWPIFAPFEVVVHNTPQDCWVSFLGKVLDVSPLIEKYNGQKCIKPLLAMAGKDISHWFDEKTQDIQHHIHPETGVRVPYCPHGAIPDVQVEVPAACWKPLDRPPWWQDEQYLDKNIDMSKTLEENGIADERDKFTELGLPQNFYIPSIFLYYNDDLKWALEDDEDN
ncbi:hypothetical protein D910_10071 [Dendroctonus ponderosae]